MFTLPVLADIACGHQHLRIAVAIETRSFVRMLQDIPNKAEFEGKYYGTETLKQMISESHHP